MNFAELHVALFGMQVGTRDVDRRLGRKELAYASSGIATPGVGEMDASGILRNAQLA